MMCVKTKISCWKIQVGLGENELNERIKKKFIIYAKTQHKRSEH